MVLGLEYVLQEYGRERYAGNIGMVGVVHGIERVFGSAGLDEVRGIGMGVLERVGGVKDLLKKFAS
jgi:hypothetical protein